MKQKKNTDPSTEHAGYTHLRQKLSSVLLVQMVLNVAGYGYHTMVDHLPMWLLWLLIINTIAMFGLALVIAPRQMIITFGSIIGSLLITAAIGAAYLWVIASFMPGVSTAIENDNSQVLTITALTGLILLSISFGMCLHYTGKALSRFLRPKTDGTAR
ncbi:MAG TPA: hypothetical protein VFG56_00405 [Candidatus Saccharimonadales bacterium]|nr:hypothetical protein [Candidatus Saccharimonadales bacterium]